MIAIVCLLALAAPDAGVKAKPKAPAPKLAPAKPPAAPKPPPTASKPTPYKAGAWNRAWRRATLTLGEDGVLLVGVVVQTDKGDWLEHITLRVPSDGGPIKARGDQILVAEKTPPALTKALLELVKQVDDMVGAAAHAGKLNR